MREWTKNRSYDKQNENDNGAKVRKENNWQTAATQRSIRDPDCKERVRCSEGVSESWILILGV
jgi:hypothetical protein